MTEHTTPSVDQDEQFAKSGTYSELGSDQSELESTSYSILTTANYTEHHGEEFDIQAKWESDESMRAEYARLTFELIDNIVDGGYDTVLFLDKSARPVSWLVRELWPLVSTKPMPEMKFVNIDANRTMERGETAERPNAEEVMSHFQPSASQIHDLHEVFSIPNQPDKTFLDGQNILVVDEVKVTGSSTIIAEKLIETAFPGSKVDTAHWLSGQTKQSMIDPHMKVTQSTDLPVWYSANDERGRGIGNADPDGNQFLSQPSINYVDSNYQRQTIRPVEDKLAQQLRAEIHQLASDIKSGRQGVEPPTSIMLEAAMYETAADGSIDFSKPKYKIIAKDQAKWDAYLARRQRK